MTLIYIVAIISVIAIIGSIVWFALQDHTLDCSNNGCTQACNQGRTCTCGWPGTPEQCSASCYKMQQQHRLEDEFNNANWPFPKSKP